MRRPLEDGLPLPPYAADLLLIHRLRIAGRAAARHRFVLAFNRLIAQLRPKRTAHK